MVLEKAHLQKNFHLQQTSHFSAGDIISKVNGEKYEVNKVVADKNKNQDILADCVFEILKK